MLSSLQLSEGTVVILDETGLEPGEVRLWQPFLANVSSVPRGTALASSTGARVVDRGSTPLSPG